MLDQVVPGIGLVALVLLRGGLGEELRGVEPPDGVGAEAGDGLGPELVAVAGDRGDVDRAAADRPEAAIVRAGALASLPRWAIQDCD